MRLFANQRRFGNGIDRSSLKVIAKVNKKTLLDLV